MQFLCVAYLYSTMFHTFCQFNRSQVDDQMLSHRKKIPLQINCQISLTAPRNEYDWNKSPFWLLWMTLQLEMLIVQCTWIVSIWRWCLIHSLFRYIRNEYFNKWFTWIILRAIGHKMVFIYVWLWNCMQIFILQNAYI